LYNTTQTNETREKIQRRPWEGHALNDPKLKQRKVYGRQDLNHPKLKHDVDIFGKFSCKTLALHMHYKSSTCILTFLATTVMPLHLRALHGVKTVSIII
jgi:hypothetical protein